MKILNFILLFFFASNLISQSTIKGKVSADSPDFYNANIILLLNDSREMSKGALTDESGSFMLENIVSDSYIIEISALGFTTFQKEILVENGDIDLGLVELSTDTEIIEGVSITAKKPVFEKRADRLVVNVQNAVSSAGANALDIISRSPGVSVDRINNVISLMGKNNVIVAINGKRSRLDMEGLIQLLEATPSANIKNIELINNPPSSYDADGDAGVINVVMVKGVEDGFNGNVNGFVGYGERQKFGGGLNFNVKKGRVNLYGDLSTNNDWSNQDVTITQEIQYPNRFVNSSQNGMRPPVTRNHSARIGLDLEITDKLSYASFISGSLRIWDMKSNSTTTYEGDELLSEERLYSEEKNETDHFMVSNNISYQLSESSKLSFDYDYLNYEIDNPTIYDLRRFNTSDNLFDQFSFESSKLTPFSFNVLKTDYITTMDDNWKFEMGAKATLAMVENDTELVTFNPDPVVDNFFTDALNMDEKVYAGYTSISGSLDDQWELSAGVRYEQYILDLDSEFDGDIIDRDIGRFFPNLTLSYTIEEGRTLSLSHTQRVSRPGFQILAPAFYFLDLNTVLGGNINARQTISRSIGMDYSHNGIFFNLSFTDEEDPLSWGQPDINGEKNVLILAARNFNDRKLYNTSLSFPITLSEKWTARINWNSMYRQERATLDGLEIKNDGFAHFGNFTSNYKVNDEWSFEFSGRYNSPVQIGLAVFRPRVSTNLGIQKAFKNNSKLSLSWSDIGDTGSFFAIETDRPEDGVAYTWNYELEGNVVRLTYSMPFGQKGLKVKGPHQSGSTDEQNRATN